MDHLVWFTAEYDCRFVGRASGKEAAMELADRQLERDFGARLGKGQQIDGFWLPATENQYNGTLYAINAGADRVPYQSVFISPVSI